MGFISINALTQGATEIQIIKERKDFISIHALTQGATGVEGSGLGAPCYFNSRPYARGDETEYTEDELPAVFQFTPLRKGRQQKICVFSRSFVQTLQIIVL